MQSADIVVIGAGVVGCSVAWHLASLLSPAQAARVLVLEREQIGSGTGAQSSGILRTHYSVPENVELARRSWPVFERFAEVLGDEDASAGLVRCGYLIAAPAGDKAAALASSSPSTSAKRSNTGHERRASSTFSGTE
jgi:sarcosine oxidase, subunit beta